MIVEYTQCSISATGSVTPAAKIQIVPVSSSGQLRLLSLQISYADTGSCYVQLHDALAANVLTSATMVWPFGLLLDASTSIIQLVSYGQDAPAFRTAVTLAASSTQNSYTASTKVFVAKGAWL